jgi:hypothetical protein
MYKKESNKRQLQKETPKSRKRDSAPGRTSLAPYLSRAIVILGCFILFLPLFVDYHFYSPHIFIKSLLFRLATQAMALCYAILAVISLEYRPRFTRLGLALSAYFAIIVISALPGISINPWYSWWGDFLRMNGVFTQLHLLIYLFVLAQTLKRDREWLTLFTASLFSTVLMGATGLIQVMGFDEIFRPMTLDPRMKGATGNPDFFGTYMLLSFFIALYFLIRKDRKEI